MIVEQYIEQKDWRAIHKFQIEHKLCFRTATNQVLNQKEYNKHISENQWKHIKQVALKNKKPIRIIINKTLNEYYE